MCGENVCDLRVVAGETYGDGARAIGHPPRLYMGNKRAFTRFLRVITVVNGYWIGLLHTLRHAEYCPKVHDINKVRKHSLKLSSDMMTQLTNKSQETVISFSRVLQ